MSHWTKSKRPSLFINHFNIKTFVSAVLEVLKCTGPSTYVYHLRVSDFSCRVKWYNQGQGKYFIIEINIVFAKQPRQQLCILWAFDLMHPASDQTLQGKHWNPPHLNCRPFKKILFEDLCCVIKVFPASSASAKGANVLKDRLKTFCSALLAHGCDEIYTASLDSLH